MALRHVLRLWLLAVGAVLVALMAVAPTARAGTAPAQQAAQILALLPGGPYRVREASDREFWFDLLGPDHNPVGNLRLLRAGEDQPHRVHSRSFAIEIGNVIPDARVTEALVKAANTIVERDDGSWAMVVPSSKQLVPLGQWPATLVLLTVALFLGTWQGWRVSWEVRVPHLLPAAIQVVLYAYWSLYWHDVGQHVPSLVLQLVMGFAIDASFSFVRFGSWRIGASPLPIVLSTNLFAWFSTPGILISLVAAFATKTYLRRNGRHLLNPSAAGLTVAGICNTLWPHAIPFGGVFHTMNMAPNLAELILILSLVPQMRFRIVPVSIAALLAMRSYDNPAIHRPAMLLAIVLLATDPATIPKTDVGKLLFGGLVGLGIGFTSYLLRATGNPDDFSKVMVIPLANALVPVFDGLAARLPARLASIPSWARLRDGARRWIAARWPDWSGSWVVPNKALVACWVALVLPAFGAEKREAFEPAYYWTWGTPLVVRDADDVPRCPANPVFCEPFSFAKEAVAWTRRERAVSDSSW